MKHTELANDYFERHTLSKECHITSDGRVFHTIGHAMSFAQEHNLEPQTIESYIKNDDDELDFQERFAPEVTENVELSESAETDIEEIEEIEEIEDSDLNSQESEDQQIDTNIASETEEYQKTTEETSSDEKLDKVFETPAGEIALEVFLKNSDVDVLKYDDLKKLAKHFNLQTVDQKADTLKTALTEFKNSLN